MVHADHTLVAYFTPAEKAWHTLFAVEAVKTVINQEVRFVLYPQDECPNNGYSLERIARECASSVEQVKLALGRFIENGHIECHCEKGIWQNRILIVRYSPGDVLKASNLSEAERTLPVLAGFERNRAMDEKIVILKVTPEEAGIILDAQENPKNGKLGRFNQSLRREMKKYGIIKERLGWLVLDAPLKERIATFQLHHPNGKRCMVLQGAPREGACWQELRDIFESHQVEEPMKELEIEGSSDQPVAEGTPEESLHNHTDADLIEMIASTTIQIEDLRAQLERFQGERARRRRARIAEERDALLRCERELEQQLARIREEAQRLEAELVD